MSCPHAGQGSISAWAEEPQLKRLCAGLAGVDLRVGGGAAFAHSAASIMRGRSPRGRRSRQVKLFGEWVEGSISAWAEEPVLPRGMRKKSRVDLRVCAPVRK